MSLPSTQVSRPDACFMFPFLFCSHEFMSVCLGSFVFTWLTDCGMRCKAINSQGMEWTNVSDITSTLGVCSAKGNYFGMELPWAGYNTVRFGKRANWVLKINDSNDVPYLFWNTRHPLQASLSLQGWHARKKATGGFRCFASFHGNPLVKTACIWEGPLSLGKCGCINVADLPTNHPRIHKDS